MNKKNAARNALFTSVVSLLLCVSMLVGTTFAWFTDEVVSGMNTIAAGNLDVELLANGVEVKSDTKLFNLVDAQGDDTWWEPGMVVYENLQVANVGTLALKYEMALNFGNENNLDGHKLSEVLKVAVLEQTIDTSSMTRADVLELAKTAVPTALRDFALIGELEAGVSGPAFAVVIFWEPNANEVDNLYNANNDKTTSDGEPLRIEFGVKLQATQKMSEEDSFGPDYDEDATIHSFGVDNADEAFEAFSSLDQSGNRGAVYLNADYKTSDAQNHWSSNREYAIRRNTDTQDSSQVTLNLNGHTITNDREYQDGKNTGVTYVFTTAYTGKLTVNGDGKIYAENSAGKTAIFYAQGPSDIVINGGEYEVVDGIAVWAGGSTGSTGNIIINDGTFISSGNKNDNGVTDELIYSSGGVVTINGGFFHNTEDPKNSTLNIMDTQSSIAFIDIYGGTFVNYNPADPDRNDPGNIRVMDGYKVVSETQENGDVWYTVVPNTVDNAADLVASLEAGKSVTLNADVALDNAIAVAAGSKATLDLNGHTLSVKNETAAASCAVNNKGELTLKNGTVTYEGVGDPNFGYGTNTINNTGKLIIDGATIVNTTTSGSSVAIDCSAGAELIINSGEIKSEKNAIRLCPFGSSAISCTINGGTITGARAVQIHLPSNKPAEAPVINLTVNDGTLNGTGGMSIYSYSYGQSFANVNVALNGGIFNNDVCFGGGTAKTTQETVTVTGGTFNGVLGRYVEDDGTNNGWADIAKP